MDSGTRWAKHASRFGKLAKQLDMELESAVMQRVFNEIDEEHSARAPLGSMLEHGAPGRFPFELQLRCGPDFDHFALIFDERFSQTLFGGTI